MRPCFEATQLAQTVASTGSILSIAPPAVNSSWSVSMQAPTLSCDHINDKLLNATKDNIANAMEIWLNSLDLEHPEHERRYAFFTNMFSYMSWPGASEDLSSDLTAQMPFASVGDQSPSTVLREGFMQRNISLFQPDLLFVAVLPRLLSSMESASDSMLAVLEDRNLSDAGVVREVMDWAFDGATVLCCKTLPSEYTLHFSYSGSSQEQKIEISHIAQIDLDLGDDSIEDQLYHGADDPGCFYLSGPTAPECVIARETLYRWSFRAIVDIFADLITGAADRGSSSRNETARLGYGHSVSASYNTKVFSTSLMDTVELEPWSRDRESAPKLLDDEDATRALNEAYSLSRVTSQPNKRKSLREAIEELFFNITISMASSPQLT